MSAAEQVRLGLVGYGEVGSTLGRGLRGAGLGHVVAFDLHGADGPYAGLIQGRAREAGVALLPDAAALAAEADVILGVTPGSASVDSAAALAPHLTPGHVFVDVASATPRIKRQVAEIVAPSGVLCGDASIVGTPADGHGLPILASGPAAERMRDALIPWGMRIEAVGPEIGTASGIKILRSVVMKGLEALLVECLLGASELGIDGTILASIDRSFQRSFPAMANALLTTGAIHAERRAEEVAMSAEALADAGLNPVMANAAAARLRWVAGLGLKERFGGVVPPDYATVLRAMKERGALG
jgi:3-hydroxyisobutyrate dehydrogenase-like beta-hydroxyacid dehydrogenase